VNKYKIINSTQSLKLGMEINVDKSKIGSYIKVNELSTQLSFKLERIDSKTIRLRSPHITFTAIKIK